MTTRRMMILVGGIALVFGVAVEIRRALNRRTRDRAIVAYSQLESHYLQGAKRAQAKVKEFREMERRALELVGTGEFTPEAGHRRVQARQRQREFWEAQRDLCIANARWSADRVNLLRMEAASGELYDHDADVRISIEHEKKALSESRKTTEDWNSRSARDISTPRP
jgi:hypothetical protein